MLQAWETAKGFKQEIRFKQGTYTKRSRNRNSVLKLIVAKRKTSLYCLFASLYRNNTLLDEPKTQWLPRGTFIADIPLGSELSI